MNFRSVAASAIACSAVLLGQAASSAEPRAVIELFTSQGCSSCPAADKLMGELSQDPSLVTMSLPVDYWDYLGWKDTLALHGHSSRERAYANARGDREVYTPQVVVNGTAQVLGSDKAAIEQAIDKTRRTALSVPVKLTVSGDKISASIPAAQGVSGEPRSGEVWLCPITGKVTVDVGRGENHGRSLTYYNVVRGWTKLGDWNGQAQTFELSLAKVAGANIDTVAVVVQSGTSAKPGLMVGAATASLK